MKLKRFSNTSNNANIHEKAHAFWVHVFTAVASDRWHYTFRSCYQSNDNKINKVTYKIVFWFFFLVFFHLMYFEWNFLIRNDNVCMIFLYPSSLSLAVKYVYLSSMSLFFKLTFAFIWSLSHEICLQFTCFTSLYFQL